MSLINENIVIITANQLAEKIVEKHEELIRVLTKVESYKYAIDEVERSVDCLKNIKRECQFIRKTVRQIASFMPINQPLYGLVLFGIVPSFMSELIFIRPAADTRDFVESVAEILQLHKTCPNINILKITRREFIAGYVCDADVVIFVGKYENAESMKKCIKKDALLLYSGAGMNPFVIADNTNLERVVEKAIAARVYNSGQDCAAPNVFLVRQNYKNEFRELLVEKISKLKCGDYADDEVIVGPLIRESALFEAMNLILKNRSKLIYGGIIDIARKIIYPAVIETDITDQLIYREFFSPVFTIAYFEREIDLKQYFWDERYSSYAMYVSLFGSLEHEEYLNNSVILKEKSVLDEEQGNMPFGGFGSRANYVWKNGVESNRPFLISEEISKYCF